MSHLTTDAVFRPRLARNARCHTMSHLTAAGRITLEMISRRRPPLPGADRQALCCTSSGGIGVAPGQAYTMYTILQYNMIVDSTNGLFRASATLVPK